MSEAGRTKQQRAENVARANAEVEQVSVDLGLGYSPGD